jgi:polar amino acid transport system substrate-binding protein
MRLKIFSALFLMLMILAGCGNDTPQSQEKVEKVGMLTRSNLDEKQIDDYTKNFNSAHGVTTAQQTTYYNSLNSMQMGLTSGQIDSIRTYGSVANYMAGKDSKLEIKDSQTVQLVDNFSCALRDGDTELKAQFNAAIDSMKNDGTLNNLVEKYIKNLKPDEDPPAVAMPKIENADTIKVGVTGDLPPLDLILADGKPAGFNTAVLAEISQRIGKNIELVTIESNARAAALVAGTIDVVFWTVTPEGESPLPANSDTPDGVILTNSYYQDVVVDVGLGAVFAGM